MSFPAARLFEVNGCPVHGLGKAYEGAANVHVNGRWSVRGSDKCACPGGPDDVVVTGAATVHINGRPAARLTSKTMHGGGPIPGSPNVLIGGSSEGVTVGNRGAASKACEDAKGGREPPPGAIDPRNGAPLAPHTQRQSYNNCGLECCRQLINKATGKNISQEELLKDAQEHPSVVPHPPQRVHQTEGTMDPDKVWRSGGTAPEDEADILSRHGVPAKVVENEGDGIGQMAQAASEGRGTIAIIKAGNLWPPSLGVSPGEGDHAILVTAVMYDADGNIKTVVINDTGSGACGQEVPVDKFRGALHPTYNKHIETTGRVF